VFLNELADRDIRVRQGLPVSSTSRSSATNTAAGGQPELLMRGVEQAAARVYGSNGETKRARELANAIATYYGLPQVFFTINFNTNSTATLAYCAGKLQPQVNNNLLY
jgi:hypothetical protein